MLIIENQDFFDTVKAFAEKAGRTKQLQEQLDYLEGYACPKDDPTKTVCVLYPDGAPFSFGFVMLEKRKEFGTLVLSADALKADRNFRDRAYSRWFNGGLIFHGPHDDHGVTGAAPTFAVTLEPTDGWSIHT